MFSSPNRVVVVPGNSNLEFLRKRSSAGLPNKISNTCLIDYKAFITSSEMYTVYKVNTRYYPQKGGDNTDSCCSTRPGAALLAAGCKPLTICTYGSTY